MEFDFRSVWAGWDRIPAKVVFISLDYKVLWANARARRDYEQKGMHYEGRPCHELIRSLSAICNECPFPMALSSRRCISARLEYPSTDRITGSFLVELLPVLSGSGEVEFFIHIEQDILDEMEQESVQEKIWNKIPRQIGHWYADIAAQQRELEAGRQEIKRQKAQMEAIFSGFQDSLFILNPQYEILMANTTFLGRWAGGRSFEEIKGRKCHVLIHNSEEPCPQCTVTQTILTGRAVSGERYLEAIDQIFFQQAYPIFNQNGEMTSIIRYSRNITEEKRLQEQLIQAEKLAGIGILSSGVAHEINNPLTGILGLAEILQKIDDPTLKEQYLKEIIACSKKVADIVKDLSTYSRGSW